MKTFKRLAVSLHLTMKLERKILVAWALDSTFNIPGPYVFTLYRGYSATDDMLAVSTVTDQNWLYDNYPVVPHTDTCIFYQVTVQASDGVIYESQVVPLDNALSAYDWLLAKDIIRKESMLLTKRTGVKGYLLKRRLFGSPCSACLDLDTLQVLNSLCTVCYGTGVVGGYYPATEYWVTYNQAQKTKKLTTEEGATVENIELFRALAYPMPSPNDVWVNSHTDQRYIIQPDIKSIARHRGVDLVLDIPAREEARASVIYNIAVF